MKAKENTSVNKQIKENAFFGSRGQGSNITNPFLMMIFFRTSFNAWRNYMLRKVVQQKWKREVEEQRKQFAALGKEFIEPELPEEKKHIEEIEIEREVLIEMSCSDEEIGDGDKFDRRSMN